MKKTFLILLSVSLGIFSCDSNDDFAPIDPNGFAVATANYSGPSTVAENEGSITVDVNLSKPSSGATPFTISQVGGTAVEGEDFTLTNLNIPSFNTSGELVVNVIDNPFPQPDRTAILEVSTPEFGTELLNPSSNLPYQINLTISDVNSTDGVTIGFDWNHDHADDLDLTIFDDFGNELRFLATADVPEIGVLLLNSDPDGTYYVDMQPYSFSEPQIDFNFGISTPNGDISEFTGTFDTENLGSYTSDESPVLGTSYRLLQIVKSGTNYTITQL